MHLKAFWKHLHMMLLFYMLIKKFAVFEMNSAKY